MTAPVPPAKNLFLLGQTISRLASHLTADQRRLHVCGKVAKNDTEPVAATRPDDAGKEPWAAMDRTAVAALATGDKPAKRVAVVCDAGLGKSTNMQWLESMVARTPGDARVPLLLRLDDANKPHRQLIEAESKEPSESEAHLLKYLGAELVRLAPDFRPDVGELARLRDRGGIVLLIDGLDHALSHDHFAYHLAKVLGSEQWKSCPVWIAGRPYAFDQCWDAVFGDGWQYLRVNALAEPEIRRYMTWHAGGDWYDLLADAGELLAVPRLLQLVCRVLKRSRPVAGNTTAARRAAVRELGLHTPSDVYHRAYFDRGTYGKPDTYGLLAQGVGVAERIGLDDGEYPSDLNQRRRVTRAADLVGVIAFTLMSGEPGAKPPKPNTTGLTLDALESALTPRLGPSGLGNRDALERDLGLLRVMNTHALDFLLFNDAGEKHWVFHDPTALAFFAAYWAMKRGTAEDVAAMDRWAGDEAYAEFWRFAAEMPDPLVDRERWLSVFTRYFPPPQAAAEDDSTLWHRRMICHSFAGMELRSPATVAAWRQSFHDLATGTKTQKRIHAEIVGGFRVIPAGECPFGAKEPSTIYSVFLPPVLGWMV